MYIQVEYDPDFAGGNYSSVGNLPTLMLTPPTWKKHLRNKLAYLAPVSFIGALMNYTMQMAVSTKKTNQGCT